MAEKLKSVLKTPKLRLGAKAFAIALALYALPLWAAVLFAFVLYLRQPAFSMNFLGTFVSLFIVFNAFQSANILPLVLISALAAVLFYVLLGVKNMAFLHRLTAFFILLAITVFASLWGFFAGALSLLLASFVIFLVCRDALASFTPAPNRSVFLAAVSAFVVAQLSWAIFYLNIPVWLAVTTTALVFAGFFHLIIQHLRGALFRSDAPFLAVAAIITAFAILIMAVF